MGSRRFRVAKLILLVMTGGFTLCAQQSPRKPDALQPQASVAVTVQDLAARPDRYLGSVVRVSGTLENQGKNYFTDLRLVLKDRENRTIHVRPWLPLSLPPRPLSATVPDKRPAVLSDYLGKGVELTAEILQGPLRHVGDTYYLEVKQARVIP